MKKFLWILTAILVAVSLLTAGVSAYAKPADVSEVNVVATANEVMPAPNSEKVLESRFLNMLNRNYVYGTDFESVNAIVDNSVIALLSLRENEDSSYIAENYAHNISLDTLAHIAGMNPRYFCRYFRSMTERTPIDYLNYYRVECASYFLTTSDMTVAEIAQHCGYNDSSFFIKQFRRYKGTTPRQYRTGNQDEKLYHEQ